MDLIKKRGENIWQTFFFASVSDPPRFNQTSFYKFLKDTLHFETIILGLAQRTIHCKNCDKSRTVPTEKGVDVALATRMLTLANTRTFETAVLVSGDRDFLETVRSIKAQGMRVEIYSWRSALSKELSSESSDDVVFLDDHKKELELTGPSDKEAETLLDVEAQPHK